MSTTGNEQNQGLQDLRRAIFGGVEQDSQGRRVAPRGLMAATLTESAGGTNQMPDDSAFEPREEDDLTGGEVQEVDEEDPEDAGEDAHMAGSLSLPPFEHFVGVLGEREPQNRPIPKYHEAVHSFKRRLLSNALRRNKWNVSRTAVQLGIQRSHLYKLMDGHDLARPEKTKTDH